MLKDAVRKRHIIGPLIVLIIGGIIGILAYRYYDKVGYVIEALDAGKYDNAFEAYKVKKEETGNSYMVSYKDVMVSAQDMDRKVYYRFDITLESADSKTADNLKDNHEKTISVIRSVMGVHKTKQVGSGPGRESIKAQIKQELKKQMGVTDIKGIYFENLVYN